MTNDDMTLRGMPGQSSGMQQLDSTAGLREANDDGAPQSQTQLQSQSQTQQQTQQSPQQQQAQQQAQAVKCPNCGATNDAGSLYCASCGQVLRRQTCPNCGAELDGDADFCESCHHYISTSACSFCGAHLSEQDAFCPECGSPRGGIVCPTCHTLNEFSFCKQCGRALTEEAAQLVKELQMQPEYQELAAAAKELDELQMQLPFESEEDVKTARKCDELRQRVLRLLAQDAGVVNVVIPPVGEERMSKEEHAARKAELMERISNLLERIPVPANPKPAQVRNYAMAQKPQGLRLAWLCNYKHAMHSSPCGCAKPQLGGKWVVLGHGSKQEIKDDK